MPFPRFYLISDRHRMGSDPAGAVRRLAAAGLPAFQWREKDLSPAENQAFLQDLVEGGTARTRLLVNDRVDLAAALEIGVHIPENGLPTRVARRLLPAEAWIGRSTHTLDGARHARDEGADFVTFGPIYDTPSKRTFGPPVGIAALREATHALEGFPILALGGITLSRVNACLEAGASGIAVIAAVWDSADPVASWLAFAKALEIEPASP